MHALPAYRQGEQLIICLPHKLVIIVRGGENEYDGWYKMRSSKRFAASGMLAALALIAFMIESLLPRCSLSRRGQNRLSSVFVSLCLILYGERDALLVLIVKCALGSVFSGNVFSLYYSLPAGLAVLASLSPSYFTDGLPQGERALY